MFYTLYNYRAIAWFLINEYVNRGESRLMRVFKNGFKMKIEVNLELILPENHKKCIHTPHPIQAEYDEKNRIIIDVKNLISAYKCINCGVNLEISTWKEREF